MSSEVLKEVKISDFLDVTDYVANGSFAALKANVTYKDIPDYAVMIRLADFNSGWSKDFVYVDKHGFDFLKKTVVFPGDLIISNVGANAGTVFRAPELGLPMTLGPNSVLIRPKEDKPFLKDYLYYFFTSAKGQHLLKSILSGSAQPKFNKTDLRSCCIDLPINEDYEKYAKPLFDLDQKIELNTQTNQTLEQIAQAIFKSWFVDFEPVKAKIETLAAGGSADDAELAAMSVISAKTNDELNGLKASNPEAFNKLAQTAALFPAAMQDSELGEIPEGWCVVRVRDIVKRLKPSKRYTKKQVEPHGKIPVYEQGAGILLGFHNDDAGFEANPKDPIFIFGDHTCVTHLSCSSFDISSNVIPLKGSVRPTIWTYFAIQGKQEFQEYRRHWSELIIKDIVLPSKQLAEIYAELVTTKYLMIESFQRESKELELLRDTLLPKLLSGEIDLTSEVTA